MSTAAALESLMKGPDNEYNALRARREERGPEDLKSQSIEKMGTIYIKQRTEQREFQTKRLEGAKVQRYE